MKMTKLPVMRLLSAVGAVLGTALLLCAFSAVVMAQEPDSAQDSNDPYTYKKPMPDIKAAPADAFEADTVSYRDKPFSDDALSYVVRLPSSWKKSEHQRSGADMQALSTKILAEAGLYYGPVSMESGFPSRFSVNAVGLDYELTAEQWFMQHLISNGYALQGLSIESEDRAEALYVLIERDTSFVVRAVAIKNGKRIVLAQYYMPIERWEEEKHTQVSVMQSFKLISPDDSLVETMKPYYFLDLAHLQYPESWKLRAPPVRSLDRMHVQLLSIAPKSESDWDPDRLILDGKIEVFLVSVFSADSMESEFKRIKSRAQGKKFMFTEAGLPETQVDLNPLFEKAKTQTFSVDNKESNLLNYEFWATQMMHGEYYYFVTLLTPSQKDDYYVWSRNTETYKLVLSLLEPQEHSLAYDE